MASTVTTASSVARTRRVLALARARRYSMTGDGHRIRLDHGLALADIAAGVGVGISTIYRWETGRARPRGDAAVRWVDLLDTLDSPESAA